MSVPQLRYSLQLSQGPASNLTYVNVGQTATLTFTVSNPGDPVPVTSLRFGLPPFGPNATDLALPGATVQAILPDGWTPVPHELFTYAPPPTNPYVGTGAVVFAFSVAISPAVGTAQVGIREITSAGTAFVPPFPVTKMSGNFVLMDLVASPAKVVPGDTVSLSWTGTPGLTYSVTYPGGQAFVTVPSAGKGAWPSPPIRTNFPFVAFTVTGSVDSPGGVVSAQVTAGVTVDVPEVLSFPQPGGTFFAGPVALTWTTYNADHCRLFANGTLVDDHAPANTPPGGYPVLPTTATTAYALYAVKGAASVGAPAVTVAVMHAVTPIGQVAVPELGGTEQILVSADGSRLYYRAANRITAVDTVYTQVLWTATLPPDFRVSGPIRLSPDGRHLYVFVPPWTVQAIDTQSGAFSPVRVNRPAWLFALSPDGTVLYDLVVVYPGQVRLVACSLPSGRRLWDVALMNGEGRLYDAVVTPDGNWLYLLSQSSLWRVDLVQQTFTRVAATVPSRITMGSNGRLFVGLSRPVPTVGMLTVPDGVLQRQFEFPALAGSTGFAGIAVDGAGALYVSCVYADRTVGIYYVDPGTGQTGLVASASYPHEQAFPTDAGAIAINPATGRVYWAVESWRDPWTSAALLLVGRPTGLALGGANEAEDTGTPTLTYAASSPGGRAALTGDSNVAGTLVAFEPSGLFHSAPRRADALSRFGLPSLPTFSGSALDARLIDLGLLLGILQSETGDPSERQSVNIGWFASVLSNLSQIPERAVPLLDLLRRLLGRLGDPVPIDPPDGQASRDWYSVPYDGVDTGFYVVLPADTAAAGNLISLGFSKTYAEGAVTVHAYGVIPVFEVPASAADVFVLGRTPTPIEIHLDVVQAGVSTQVNGLRLTGRLSFHDNPTFELKLLASATVQKVYTKVADLLAGHLGGARRGALGGASRGARGGVANSVDDTAMGALRRIVAQSAVQHFLAKPLGSTHATPGTILGPAPAGLGFLAPSDGGGYALADLAPFEGRSSVQWAMQVVRVILGAVADSDRPLVPVGTAPAGSPAPGIYVHAEPEGGGIDYGIRLAFPPIALPLQSPGAEPPLTLQLGGWLAGEQDGQTWWSRAAVGEGVPAQPSPGIALFLVHADSRSALSFTGRLELASVGVDFQPPPHTPLAKLGSFTLASVQARGYVKLDLTAPGHVVTTHGGALMCHDIGIPLGPSFGAGDGVVQSLLASGGAHDPQASQPVNPPFSLSAAFVSGSDKPVSVQLYDAAGQPGALVWLPMQRSFGPLHLDKLGVGWRDAVPGSTPAELTLHLNGGVTLGPLGVELIDLAIGMPPAHPLEPSGYTVGLSGMNVSFDQDPVALDGGLVHQNGEYVGQASLELKEFGIGAIGAYGTTGGSPSLFVFGWTNKAIGGPPYAYVTGLAAGFGFNRALNLPTVDQVQTFPLVAALSAADPFGGGDAPPSPSKQLGEARNALSSLADGHWVPMRRGEYWFAAGVQFTSFEMVRTSALVAVEFGPDLTIAVLGLSKFQLGSNEHPYVYVELELLASLKPNDGVLMVQAELSPNSYVFSPDCHLTGGFAFGLWFGGDHEGDFVVTVGGYHPLFRRPLYYPIVPRLGFTWAVSDHVSIQGDAYFAITPGSAMAGGGLQAAYHSGNLRAWVDAQADLLVQWRPFHFDADIYVGVGVSYKINLLFTSVTLTAELGAGMALWGPPTGGRVEVDWYVISFSIPFGSGVSDSDPIGWEDFVANLVPNQAAPRARAALGERGAPGTAASLQPRIDVELTGGRVREDPATGWVVRADGLAFTVRSSVPARDVSFAGHPSALATADDHAMGIVPLELASVKSELTVDIVPVGSARINGTFTPLLHASNVPAAMWGQAPAARPSADTVSLPVGLHAAADPYVAMGVPPIALTTLEFDTIDPPTSAGGPGADAPPAPLPLSPSAGVTPASGAEDSGSLGVIQQTILATAADMRREVLAALAAYGYGTGLTGAPTGLAGHVTVELRAPVMLGSPAGVTWPTPTHRATESV